MDDWIIYTILVLVGGLIGVAIGFWRDPVARTRMLRRFDKKNHIILGVISKDSKTITQITVNADKDIVKVGNSLWVIEQGRIYRKDKPQTGFFIGKEMIKWEEGVPTVYVYSDSMKPATFDSIDKTSITPDAAGATILAFISNELLKGLIAVQEYKMMLMLCIVGIILVGFGVYLTYQEANLAHKAADTAVAYDLVIMDHFNIPLPSANQSKNTTGSTTTTDSTIVIKG